MRFAMAGGPEIETEYYNFDALNIPAYHPARDMWDTFWLRPDDKKPLVGVENRKLLRTHTSPVQVRYAESHHPPIRIIVPGKTYRHEATDATHGAEFYQIEGLMIEKDVSLANLKFVLNNYFEELFGIKSEIKFRPSYFPFTEPSVEVDLRCFLCEGKGCGLCKKTGWIEIMGAGMVHPRVLEAMKINPRKFRGFAFGGGVDRLAMLKFGIDDIRLLYNGDLRTINQF
jgi:phenylalanyl-tRNA synthetase alpha chain